MIKSELNKLDENLKEKRPEYYKTLQLPLSDDAISNLEQTYKVVLPNDLKELYQWKNGQQYDCYASFVNNAMFQPLEEVLQISKEFNEMIGYDFQIKNWWNENWLPIFSNGGGSYLCYDIKGVFTNKVGQLIEFWKGDNDRNVIAPNLSEFLGALNTYLVETPATEYDSYFDVSDRIGQWRTTFIVDQPLS
ncbi:SMI1/KNR4 family protein [Aquimarina algicola]|uniref:SMI1/KNR4 family protein n=1 Tax=Aquimarina algicola TaxID=2589995 RepID=A0A504J1K6_9FLAO|nr:SMI1/KNR4 family protein [Aquimarina algicola]TPN84746.1 SMI1/KNR4 family protein [Aquimarina algicola]